MLGRSLSSHFRPPSLELSVSPLPRQQGQVLSQGHWEHEFLGSGGHIIPLASWHESQLQPGPSHLGLAETLFLWLWLCGVESPVTLLLFNLLGFLKILQLG